MTGSLLLGSLPTYIPTATVVLPDAPANRADHHQPRGRHHQNVPGRHTPSLAFPVSFLFRCPLPRSCSLDRAVLAAAAIAFPLASYDPDCLASALHMNETAKDLSVDVCSRLTLGPWVWTLHPSSELSGRLLVCLFKCRGEPRWAITLLLLQVAT